ncbi:MAG: ABC transporter ATP-binding protein, partial [Acidimicrobiia bacterium]|nr:ABC transporter ATP-binding protein [Acidimicrobiia bacterium]
MTSDTTTDGTAAAIVATGLARSFGGVPAVAGLDLAVTRGEIYG